MIGGNRTDALGEQCDLAVGYATDSARETAEAHAQPAGRRGLREITTADVERRWRRGERDSLLGFGLTLIVQAPTFHQPVVGQRAAVLIHAADLRIAAGCSARGRCRT